MVARQLGPSLLLMLLVLLVLLMLLMLLMLLLVLVLMLLALRQETLQVTDATYGARRLRSVG